MKTSFLDEAKLEMMEAAEFYDAQRPGLGDQFLDAVERGVADIEANPSRWPIMKKQIRRRLVGRFPYGLLYHAGKQEIIIAAVMHLHRRPRYWTQRLKEIRRRRMK